MTDFMEEDPLTGDVMGDPARMFWESVKLSDIKWNFEKFLLGPDGKLVELAPVF